MTTRSRRGHRGGVASCAWADRYRVERSTSPQSGFRASLKAGTPVDVTPEVVYYYRVVALQDDGDISQPSTSAGGEATWPNPYLLTETWSPEDVSARAWKTLWTWFGWFETCWSWIQDWTMRWGSSVMTVRGLSLKVGQRGVMTAFLGALEWGLVRRAGFMFQMSLELWRHAAGSGSHFRYPRAYVGRLVVPMGTVWEH